MQPVIRVHAIVRTARSFHAKNACSSRQYEYILPTFALNANDFGEAGEDGRREDVLNVSTLWWHCDGAIRLGCLRRHYMESDDC